jgi:hypothetical protein
MRLERQCTNKRIIIKHYTAQLSRQSLYSQRYGNRACCTELALNIYCLDLRLLLGLKLKPNMHLRQKNASQMFILLTPLTL